MFSKRITSKGKAWAIDREFLIISSIWRFNNNSVVTKKEISNLNIIVSPTGREDMINILEFSFQAKGLTLRLIWIVLRNLFIDDWNETILNWRDIGGIGKALLQSIGSQQKYAIWKSIKVVD